MTYDARIKNASTILVAGPSQSGKTTLVESIVRMKDDLFREPISSVYWYCAFPPNEKLSGVNYKVGLPDQIQHAIEPHSLVIIDDYMKELSNSDMLTSMMTKAVHHLPMTLIYITQNLFSKGSDNKTRRLNSNYLIVFKNPHDRAQINYIGRQMYPHDKDFLSSAFEDATSKHAYSYLFIDCHQDTPDEIRVRTNITKPFQKTYTPPSLQMNL
jgi:hypothetical protein